MTRRVVSIANPQGHALHCILEEPAMEPRRGIAAVLLPPGVKTRVGPHRLNRKLAQAFLSRGIPVLRTEFFGLGDSGGEIPDTRLDQMYRAVQLGSNVDDARAALDWLESRLGMRRFIFGGLCGAALTALLLAREDARLSALFAVGLPARLARPNAAPVATRGELHSHWSRYVSKLSRPGAWLRLLSLKSDYRLMWRATAERLRSRAKTPPITAAPDLNPKLAPAMLALLQTGRKALILYGEQDPQRWEFEEKFLRPWSAPLEPYRAQIEYSVIPAANHNLSTAGAVAEANRRTAAWLEELLGSLQVPDGTKNPLRAMLRSGEGSAAIGFHEAALECVVKPMQAPSRSEPLCSTNEYSSLTRLPK